MGKPEKVITLTCAVAVFLLTGCNNCEGSICGNDNDKNGVGTNKAGPTRPGATEESSSASPHPDFCMPEEVPAVTSYPISPGGSVTQAFKPNAQIVDRISVIAGVDPRVSDTQTSHRLKMSLADNNGTVLSRVEADETPQSNNKQTDFWLKAPVNLQPGDVYTVTVGNISTEIVGIYASDDVKTEYPGGGFRVDAHNGENAHNVPGSVMSGCIHTPASP